MKIVLGLPMRITHIVKPDTSYPHSTIIRTLVLLQALYLCGASIDLTITSLTTEHITQSQTLATIPYTFIALGSIITAQLGARWMVTLGRKPTLLLGCSCAALSGLFSTIGVYISNVALLCVGTFLIGLYQGIANYYKYIGADIQPQGKNIGTVAIILSGGILASCIGPFLAQYSSHILTPTYMGSYILVSLLGITALIIVSRLHLPPPTQSSQRSHHISSSHASQSYLRLIVHPTFLIGSLASFVGYYCMSSIMTVGPVVEKNLHASGNQIAFSIQLHMLCMFAPMLFLAWALRFLQASTVIMMGNIIGILESLLNIVWCNYPLILAGLMLIGLSWSFTYGAGSTILANYTGGQRNPAVRSIGEVLPSLGFALGALSSGWLFSHFNWAVLNLICLGFLIFSTINLIIQKYRTTYYRS